MCRFTTVQRTVPAASVQQVRATFQAQTQASAKNQRLAQQMANRLSLGVNAPPPPQTKPVSCCALYFCDDIFLRFCISNLCLLVSPTCIIFCKMRMHDIILIIIFKYSGSLLLKIPLSLYNYSNSVASHAHSFGRGSYPPPFVR